MVTPQMLLVAIITCSLITWVLLVIMLKGKNGKQGRIRNATELITEVYAGSNMPLMIVDRGTQVIKSVNKSATELVGERAGKLVGTAISSLWRKDVPIEYKNIVDKLKGKNNITIEAIEKGKGSYVFVELVSGEIKDKEEIVNYLILRDISELITYERELYEAKSAAEKSDKLKSSFLSNLSHEIRTPLNNIVGFSELIIEEQYSAKEKAQFTRYISENANRLLHTLTNVINISLLETNSMKIAVTQFQLYDYIKEYWNEFFNDMENPKVLELHLVANKQELDEMVNSDSSKIKHVLDILLDNAMKYTESGQITLVCEALKKGATFKIQDSGPGITLENKEAIFKPFVTPALLKGVQTGQKGLGLGLAIAARIVTLLGGEIGYKEIKTGGTEFWFTIPWKNIPAKTK